MVSLALNIQLKEKLDVIRRSKQINNAKRNKDPDYVPGLSNELGNRSGSETNRSYEYSQITSPSTKIHIVSNIMVAPPATVIQENVFDIMEPKEKEFNSIEVFIREDILQDIIDKSVEKAESKLYTKTGKIRKRKIFEEPLVERKKQKIERYRRAHEVRKACKCKLSCSQKISYTRQKHINEQYWLLPKQQQKQFVLERVKQCKKGRSTTKNQTSPRVYSYKYYLTSEKAEEVRVCKIFLLATLGYEKENDRMLKNIRKTDPKCIAPKTDGRRRSCPRKVDRNTIIEHVNSFNPTISHYRREHAPNRKYLPSDINITLMYKDFKLKYPNTDFSYELYRKIVTKDLNISFANLGNEECWECEEFAIHKKATSHDANVENLASCDLCKTWRIHKLKAINARKNYKEDAEKIKQNDEIFVAADLQKVIMLPRMETFKEVIFTPRIVAYNESFVPLGKKSKTYPCAVLWHEGVAGRSKDDIISTFYAFFQANRDIKHITIWLDNCSSQNKNWSLFSFFMYVVNSSEVAVEDITIKFFEPGHTFMAADAFHHQVELALKRKKKVYDFDDFCEVVQQANSAKVNVIKMQITQFFSFTDYTSKYKLQKLISRVYLKDIVCFHFSRGSYFFSYKTEFENEFIDLKDIFVMKYVKGTLTKPQARDKCRGISLDRKNNLISKLKGHILENRLKFWEELPVSEDGSDEENV
ncbi:unnamed protein product [Callosobruchus maculatus]|uniref:DUF7869 domain-containing protein n=1 Tax=Callosobruchus maculatus TaxID=64391 RepID=A0A653BE87_CALMS|nr:unnamed protein product [Callosobruchus maculatus]